MYRFDSLENTAMIIGTLEKADNKEELDDYYSGALEEGVVSLLYGVQDIYVNLVDSLQNVCSYAIQDDYAQWTAKKAEGGKLLLIDEADYDTQHIFFDDGINDSPNSSVDVRDLITGESMSYKRAINKFVVRVESDKALLENDYFVKKIEECERRRSEEIENMEKGLPSEEEQVHVAKVDEWAVLQQLTTNDYLSRTVLPVVYQGMKEIDIERPADPVKAFAFFLLRNQHLVKLPEKRVEEKKVEPKSGPEASGELPMEEKKAENTEAEVKVKANTKVDAAGGDKVLNAMIKLASRPGSIDETTKKEEKKGSAKKEDKKPETKKQEAKKEQKKK